MCIRPLFQYSFPSLTPDILARLLSNSNGLSRGGLRSSHRHSRNSPAGASRRVLCDIGARRSIGRDSSRDLGRRTSLDGALLDGGFLVVVIVGRSDGHSGGTIPMS